MAVPCAPMKQHEELAKMSWRQRQPMVEVTIPSILRLHFWRQMLQENAQQCYRQGLINEKFKMPRRSYVSI